MSSPQKWHPLVSNAAHPAAHPSIPPSKPWLTQSCPARSIPSQTSAPSTIPLPQVNTTHADVSNALQSGRHDSVPASKP